MSIFPESDSFNVDNVRVCKILVSFVTIDYNPCVCMLLFAYKLSALCFQGCGVTASSMLHGMVFKKEAEGDITSVKDAKIVVFSCPFDCMVTETKVTKVSIFFLLDLSSAKRDKVGFL